MGREPFRVWRFPMVEIDIRVSLDASQITRIGRLLRRTSLDEVPPVSQRRHRESLGHG